MNKKNIIIIIIIILLLSGGVTYYFFANNIDNSISTEIEKKDYSSQINELINLYSDSDNEEIKSILNELELLKTSNEENVESKLEEYKSKLEEIKNKNEELLEEEKDETEDNTSADTDENLPAESKPNGNTKPSTNETTKPQTNTTKPSTSETTKPQTNTTKPSTDTTKPATNEASKPSTDTSKPVDTPTTPSTNEVKPASGIEALLNSAPLNPIKTGYANMDNKVQSIISNNTNSSMTTYEKVKALYDWEINYMSYSMVIFDSTVYDELTNIIGLYDFDAEIVTLGYDAAVNKVGVCDSYASLFVILTRRLGLDSYYVGAKNPDGSGHATSIIRINGQFYDFDVQGEDKMMKNGKIQYIYFGKSDSEMSKYYSYVNRNQYVSDFKKFALREKFSATVTFGNATINGGAVNNDLVIKEEGGLYLSYNSYRTALFSNDNNQIIEYEKDVPLIAKVSSNSQNLKYYVIWESNKYTNVINRTSGQILGKGTVQNGEINFIVKSALPGYIQVFLQDENEKVIRYSFKVTMKEKDAPMRISGGISQPNRDEGYLHLDYAVLNSVGKITYSVEVESTTDESYVLRYDNTPYQMNDSGCKIYDLKPGYKYTFIVTATDETGNTASEKYFLNWEV